MPVKVSFDIDNADDRAAVRDMLSIYDPDQCDTGCSHTVDIAGKQAFVAILPGDDGSEESDEVPLPDPSKIGFGQQVGNVQPVTVATVVDGNPAPPPVAAVVAASVPPPPPAPPAPPAPVPDTGAATAGVTTATAPATLDKRGFPWDVRIHTSSKSINQDGTWRYKKGLNPVIKDQVEAALKGGVLVPAMPANAPPMVGNVHAQPAAVPPATVTVEPVATAAPVTSAPPPPPPVAAAPALTFAKVITQMSMARWTKAEMDARLAVHGTTMQALALRPDLYAVVYAEAGGQ